MPSFEREWEERPQSPSNDTWRHFLRLEGMKTLLIVFDINCLVVVKGEKEEREGGTFGGVVLLFGGKKSSMAYGTGSFLVDKICVEIFERERKRKSTYLLVEF
jgi:hypothetical protein